jgi:hypothetical protein
MTQPRRDTMTEFLTSMTDDHRIARDLYCPLIDSLPGAAAGTWDQRRVCCEVILGPNIKKPRAMS